MVRDAEVADAAAIAEVNHSSWQSAYSGLLPVELLTRVSRELSPERWSERLRSPVPSTTLLVWDEPGTGVTGYAYSGPERGRDPRFAGELYAIYLLEDAWRAGRGRSLMAESARRLHSAGMDSMLVWVLPSNQRARRFYEALGGVVAAEGNDDLLGFQLPEVGYGWADTTALSGRR